MTIRVLHVEDDPAQAILLRHVMKARPTIDLHQAASLAAAIEHLDTMVPALVITDLNLPDAAGDGVIDTLRATVGSQVVIMVMTADAVAADRLAAKGWDVQTKPIDVADFLQAVDLCIAGAPS